MLGALLCVLLMLAGGLGLLRLFVVEQTARSQQSEAQRLEAERQEQEAKRVNDANQAAILRLMNELQAVADQVAAIGRETGNGASARASWLVRGTGRVTLRVGAPRVGWQDVTIEVWRPRPRAW